MSVKLNTRQVGDVTVIDINRSGHSRRRVERNTRGDARSDSQRKQKDSVEFEWRAPASIDSTGIGELVAGFTSAANSGGTVKLLGVTKHVKDVLQIQQALHRFPKRMMTKHPLCRALHKGDRPPVPRLRCALLPRVLPDPASGPADRRERRSCGGWLWQPRA